MVRTAEVRYAAASDESRYFGGVEARHEVAQGFRVGGKVVERRVDVGDAVDKGDVLAVLDDIDYRLTEQATSQQLEAATTRLRQAESDWKRMQALKLDGSVSDFDDEHAESELLTARAVVEAETRKLEMARNQVRYTVLRASSGGVVTSVEFEVGQVVAAGQPGIAVANASEPEIVVNVPEDHLEAFKAGHYRAWLTSAPDDVFEVVLRELAAQAAEQTRTYRARLKPATPRELPLGASATLVAEQVLDGPPLAAIPATAITQSEGQPALWAVRRDDGESTGTVELIRVDVHGYRSDEILISGAPSGVLIVTAGVQKMAPDLRVALPQDTRDSQMTAVR
jgi:RND family efflux transporter MFP subunit